MEAGRAQRIGDLHVHFPMHVMAGEADRPLDRDVTLERMTHVRQPPQLRDKIRATVLWLASHLGNYERFGGQPRANLQQLEQGHVRLVLSVLYSPFSEIDEGMFGDPPEDNYWTDLRRQIDQVEVRLREHPDRASIVRDADDLDTTLEGSDRLAFVHCIEGGFHLGPHPDLIDERVAELSRLGVFYITLAHLFWRRVATNSNALPFMPDWLYNLVFRQPRGEGLTQLGAAAVEAMYRHRVVVDVSHMRADALDETFALLTALDRRHRADPRDYPVVASHGAYRFGGQRYNLDEPTVCRIAERDGVVGLILARHQLEDGRRRAKKLEQSVDVFCDHAERIAEITGSYRHVALGSDFDGFIKPTMVGLASAADLPDLRPGLVKRFGSANADAILFDNAHRVVRTALAARG